MQPQMLANNDPAALMVDQVLLATPEEQLGNGIWPRSTPLWMTAFYVALFIIRPWEQLFPWLGAIHFERFYILCMLVSVFFTTKKKQLAISWQILTILNFLMILILSSLLAIDPSLAWEAVYKYLTLLIFYYILLKVIHTPYDLAFIVVSYVATMTIYLLKAQWEFFVNGQHAFDMGVIRLCGIENTFGGPNNLGMSIIASLPIGLLLWQQKDVITATWPAAWKKGFKRGLQIYGVLSTTSIVLTNSRSSMVGLVVFLLLVILGGNGIGKKIGFLTAGICFLALIWLFMPEENKGRMQTIWAPEEGPANAQASAEGRVEGFKAGMEMFRRFPVLGVGPENFVAYRITNVDGVPLEAHNLAGQVLGEMGTLGGGAFLLMISATLLNCSSIRGMFRKSPSSTAQFLAELAGACRNSVLLLIFLGIFGHNLYRFNWIWLATFSDLAFQFMRKKQKLIGS